MRIELATIQDVPELQELQLKAFGPQCIELAWEDAPPMTETLEHAWLCTCKQVPEPYEFYLREGFKPFKSEVVGPGLTWVYMQRY